MLRIKKVARIFGYVFVVCGMLLVLNTATSLSGYAIINDVDIKSSSLAGVILFIIGIALLLIRRPDYESDDLEEMVLPTQRHDVKLKSRHHLRDHNKEAHAAARREYVAQHGHAPGREEMKDYKRKMHERGDIGYAADEYRHHKKAG